VQQWVKNLARSVVRSRGYAISKHPTVAFQALSVFDLAVELLQRQKGPTLKFIQVGANDGVMGDPISKFVRRYPWRGVLVEPQPDVFDRLKSNYAAQSDRLIFENVAISPTRGQLDMYRAPATLRGDSGPASGVVSVDPKVAAAQLRIPIDQLERFTVPCLPLDDLVKKYDWGDVDILTIDAEGKDCEVLLSLDLAATTPAIVQFEHGHLSPQDIDRAVGRLASHGYRVLYGGYQIDTVAVRPAALAVPE
jgi:FkbM family methyltransferase